MTSVLKAGERMEDRRNVFSSNFFSSGAQSVICIPLAFMLLSHRATITGSFFQMSNEWVGARSEMGGMEEVMNRC